MNPAEVRWRVGSHYGIHIYAITEEGEDVPVGTAMTPELAQRAVSDHNTLLSFNEWVDAKGG